MTTSDRADPPAPTRIIDEEIRFRKLEILPAFIEAGSLGRTAERLGASPISVHRALHALESGLRCTLFRPQDRSQPDGGLRHHPPLRRGLSVGRVQRQLAR